MRNDEGGPARNRPQPESLPPIVSAEAERLRPFTFRLVSGTETREATFYALSEASALKLARAWAPRGWTVTPA